MIWTKFTRLDPAEATLTHQCKICGKKISVLRNQNGSFITTNARRHFKSSHPAELLTLNVNAKRMKPQVTITAALERQRANMSTRSAKVRVEAARKAIIRFYMYCAQRISKSVVTDPSFRSMVKIISEVPESHSEKLNMSVKTLDPGVEAEYTDWKLAFREFVKQSLEHSGNNPFAQGLHDCVTLKSGEKFLAVGMSCVDPCTNGG